MPAPEVLGRNGTYIAFRKLHTAGCRLSSIPADPRLEPGRGEAAGRQDGGPLAKWRSAGAMPRHDDPELGADPQRNNRFLYADDLGGFRCPAGAHARRANPRDSLDREGNVNVRLHRMIRRGTSYGPPLPDGAGGRRSRSGHRVCVCRHATWTVSSSSSRHNGSTTASSLAHRRKRTPWSVRPTAAAGSRSLSDPFAADCRACPRWWSPVAASTASLPDCRRSTGSPPSTPSRRSSQGGDK